MQETRRCQQHICKKNDEPHMQLLFETLGNGIRDFNVAQDGRKRVVGALLKNGSQCQIAGEAALAAKAHRKGTARVDPKSRS
jgi:hypothetical protein